MTDSAIEMLRLAAKAAGHEFGVDARGPWIIDTAGVWTRWNPRDDSGQALELAVKLQIDIDFPSDHNVFAYGLWAEPVGLDRLAATRRAIVRAAAAMAQGEQP